MRQNMRDVIRGRPNLLFYFFLNIPFLEDIASDLMFGRVKVKDAEHKC